MNNVNLTIITICWNNKEGLQKTLDSLLTQTYRALEIWVIDGGSNDGTLECINEYYEKFKERKIVFNYISEKDTGIYDAMNKGIKLANGNWTTFMNAGDIPSSNQIYQEIFENDAYQDVDIIYGDRIVKCKKEMLEKAKPLNKINKTFPFCHQAILTRTELLKNRPYKEEYQIAADYEWYLNAYLEERIFKYFEKPVCIFDTTGISSVETYRTYKEFKKIQEDHFVLNDRAVIRKMKSMIMFLIDRLNKIGRKILQ